jgi:hypothetical protein
MLIAEDGGCGPLIGSPRNPVAHGFTTQLPGA